MRAVSCTGIVGQLRRRTVLAVVGEIVEIRNLVAPDVAGKKDTVHRAAMASWPVLPVEAVDRLI